MYICTSLRSFPLILNNISSKKKKKNTSRGSVLTIFLQTLRTEHGVLTPRASAPAAPGGHAQRHQRPLRAAHWPYLSVDSSHRQNPVQKNSFSLGYLLSEVQQLDKQQRLLSPEPNPLQGRRHDSLGAAVLRSSAACNTRGIKKMRSASL